jgi:hypothetical protein
MLGWSARRPAGAADLDDVPVSIGWTRRADDWESGDMATTDVAPRVPANSTDLRADGRCPACAHPWDRHDVISARYCTATIASTLTRGCICPTGA